MTFTTFERLEVVFLYGFEGWLLKINGVEFPTKYIRVDTYNVTPDQKTDLDDYTDNDGILHRNILPAKSTKIEFNTISVRQTQLQEIFKIIPEDDDDEITIEYWNPRRFRYQSGKSYVPSISFEPHIIYKDINDILFNEIRVAFIEYGEVR